MHIIFYITIIFSPDVFPYISKFYIEYTFSWEIKYSVWTIINRVLSHHW